MRPYNEKYEVSAEALGVKTKRKEDAFKMGSGVMIG
jgi:hypothetical protein